MKIRAAHIVMATLALSLVASTTAAAAGPASVNYALPSSTLNNGVGDMASTTYKLSSSLGDTTFTARQISTGLVLSPGFWHSVLGVTQGCVLDIDGNSPSRPPPMA